MFTLGMVLCLSTLSAMPLNSIYSTEYLSYKQTQPKDVTITLERSTIDETFDKTMKEFLILQKTNGGLITVKSDDNYYYLDYSTTKKQDKGDTSLTVNVSQYKDNNDLFIFLLRMSQIPGSKITMTHSTNNYLLEMYTSK